MLPVEHQAPGHGIKIQQGTLLLIIAAAQCQTKMFSAAGGNIQLKFNLQQRPPGIQQLIGRLQRTYLQHLPRLPQCNQLAGRTHQQSITVATDFTG